MPLRPEIEEILRTIPFAPGIYMMKDESGDIIYIGKAKSLVKRVRSYFRELHEHPKIRVLVSKICGIDYIETPTEVDALLLEAELVRKHQPRYNTELKDDKSFPLLKITREEFPRIHITRNQKDKKAIYYGPYTDAKLLREAVTLINSLFPIRKCQKLPKTACLYYHIGQCLAPCIKPEVKQDYDKMVGEIRAFLGGGKKSFLEYLMDRMQEAASELRFEDAQFYKDQIEALHKLRKKRFQMSDPGAGIGLSASMELKSLLKMEEVPANIVCFDVSNIQGDEAVASKVGFYRELADKIHYRRYKIKTVEGIDDYAMMQEAVGRMLIGIREGRETFIPDLIMIDGGKGHLRAAYEILQKEGFSNIKMISLAKKFETVYESAELGNTADEFQAREVMIPKDSSALYLLQKVRDEAHRFAVSYHRLLKEKNITKSILDEIPGIGEKRKSILLQNFESIDELQRSSIERIAAIPGIGTDVAEKVWKFFSA